MCNKKNGYKQIQMRPQLQTPRPKTFKLNVSQLQKQLYVSCVKSVRFFHKLSFTQFKYLVALPCDCLGFNQMTGIGLY